MGGFMIHSVGGDRGITVRPHNKGVKNNSHKWIGGGHINPTEKPRNGRKTGHLKQIGGKSMTVKSWNAWWKS